MSDVTPQDRNSYDLVPYKDFPYAFTHPRHLEALAVLFGMAPPDITRCRVLELGCAGGGNIIPQAEALPDSRFLGIDLSARQIETGRQLIDSLGLANIELRHANIMDVGPDWGPFDYIICHGVFSWVPTAVQEKILGIAAENLSPQGVAIISYNTYPGWHLANLVRDVMNYHTAQFSQPAEKIAQARAILEFLAELCPAGHAIGMLLKEELRTLDSVKNDSYLFHEFLETDNRPFYFHTFAERAGAHGLQYLAEAEISMMLLRNLPPKAQESLRRLPLLKQEQYMDFVRGRRFRKTLLCHASVPLQRDLHPELMKKFCFGLAKPLQCSQVDIRKDTVAEFRVGAGKLTSGNRMLKAAMVYLQEIYPRCIPFRELCGIALARTGSAAQVGHEAKSPEEQLANGLLAACTADFFLLCLHPPECVSRVSPRPQVRPLTRLQAERGVALSSGRHESVALTPLARQVVRRLDGRHDLGALVSCVEESVREGDLQVVHGEKVVEDPDPKFLRSLVDQSLVQISALGLLVG